MLMSRNAEEVSREQQVDPEGTLVEYIKNDLFPVKFVLGRRRMGCGWYDFQQFIKCCDGIGLKQ
jgi:hypothetical protein